jgi:hypothetical protein
MAFSSLADELNLDSGFPMSPSGPGLSLADEFGDMGGGEWDRSQRGWRHRRAAHELQLVDES